MKIAHRTPIGPATGIRGGDRATLGQLRAWVVANDLTGSSCAPARCQRRKFYCDVTGERLYRGLGVEAGTPSDGRSSKLCATRQARSAQHGRRPFFNFRRYLYQSLGNAAAPIVVDVRRAPAFDADDRMIVGAIDAPRIISPRGGAIGRIRDRLSLLRARP